MTLPIKEETCFQKISKFNALIGNPVGSRNGLRQQFDMIKEEFEELEKALTAYENLANEEGLVGADEYAAVVTELRDGMADVVVTTGGLAHRLGVDIDADLEEVYQSNMSKFIVTDNMLEVQDAAVEVGTRLEITCSASETAPGIWAITSASNQTGSDGKYYPEGKLLKPSTYREPKFSPF